MFYMYGKSQSEIWDALELVDKLNREKTRFRVYATYEEWKEFNLWLKERNKFKMTREEARKIYNHTSGGLIVVLEALGLLKFEEPKPVRKLCSAEQQNSFNFRVEEWEDNKYVLWFNGEIVWRSWKD